ncbi:MAG: hypothetical protein V7636_2446, partial [Actinomycetota bacterium]
MRDNRQYALVAATVTVSPELLAYMRQNTGNCQVVFFGGDAAQSRKAAAAARASVHSVPHPDEPDDPLASFVSDVIDLVDGSTFWFDAADAKAV